MKLWKSNWREIVALIVVNAILFALLLALGTLNVSQSGPLSTLVSLATSLVGGAAKFSMVLALAWFGVAVTFPEASRFIVGDCFDCWWKHATQHQKGNVALCAVAVLAVVAALCMAG